MSRSSEPMTSKSQTEAHPWLKGQVYEPRRQRTVELVRQAVDNLVKQRKRVSLASVIAESKAIDPEGRGVSQTGLLGNAEARAIYESHKTWKGPSRATRDAAQVGSKSAYVQRSVDPHRDTARVRNRLLRKGKEALINRVLELEQGGAVQEQQWLRVNDDLLQWRLRAEKAEGQVERMRRALEAKESQLLELREKLDDILSTSSGLTDAEARQAVKEAIRRAQKAESKAKDLESRLFAKRVVRIRDKARRIDKKGSVQFPDSSE